MSFARACKKQKVTDLPKVDECPDAPDISELDCIPCKPRCHSKGCILRIGGGNVFHEINTFLEVLGKGHQFTFKQNPNHVGQASKDALGSRPGKPSAICEEYTCFAENVEHVLNNQVVDFVTVDICAQ